MVDQAETKIEEPQMMCYVCKKMSPKAGMVEVEYADGKKVWVLAKYVRYED